MANITDAQLDAAEARGRDIAALEPRALSARYDRETRRVIVDLANGCLYAFPTSLVQDLQGANDDDLADIIVDDQGFNLNWPSLDVDIYVPAIVGGAFGSRSWMMRQFARLAGKTRSPAKAEAARSNGAKGGRPRKAAVG